MVTLLPLDRLTSNNSVLAPQGNQTISGSGTIVFADANAGRIPPMTGSFPAGSASSGTAFYYLLPYLEQGPLYAQSASASGRA